MDILLLTINPTWVLIEQIRTISLYLLPFIICILCIQNIKTIQHIWTTRKQITWVNSFLDKFTPEQSTTGKYFLLWIFLCFFSRFCTSLIFYLGTLNQSENMSMLNIPAKEEMQSFIDQWLIPAEKIEWFTVSNDMENKYVSIRSTINYWLWILALWISGLITVGWFFFLISCWNKFLRNVWRLFITISIIIAFIWLLFFINEQQLSV
jgi:hypothetical protein